MRGASRDQLRIRIEGFAPAGLSRAERIEFYQGAAAFALSIKRKELAAGLDKTGAKLAALKPSTVKHRRSAMGPVQAGAPPLVPALDLSRTIAWLRASSDEEGVTLYWAGRGGRLAWARVLGYHARIGGRVRGAPKRDVIGLSRAGVALLESRAASWWSSRGEGVSLTVRRQPGAAGRLPTQPQRPARTAPKRPSGFTVGDHSGAFTYHTRGPTPLPGSTSTGFGRFTRGRDALGAKIFGGSTYSGPSGPKPPPPLAPKRARPLSEAKRAIEEARRKQGPAPIAGSDIRDRIAKYEVGDAKIKAIAVLDAQIAAKINRLTSRYEAATRRIHELDASQDQDPAIEREIGSLRALRDNLGRRHDLLSAGRRDRVAKLLQVDTPIGVTAVATEIAATESKYDCVKPDKALMAKVDQVFAMLSSITASPGPVRIEVGRLKARGYKRSCQIDGRLHLRATVTPEVIAHELMHVYETQITAKGRNLGELGVAFRDLRAAGETPRSLAEATGIPYEAGEVGVKDEFEAAVGLRSAWYAGKVYASPHHSEVLTMGIQHFLQNPAGFCAKDPEWAKLILGVLDGSLR